MSFGGIGGRAGVVARARTVRGSACFKDSQGSGCGYSTWTFWNSISVSGGGGWWSDDPRDSAGGEEHTRGARPSTRERHEQGRARADQDRGGEAGDARRRENRRRPKGWRGPWPPRGILIVPYPIILDLELRMRVMEENAILRRWEECIHSGSRECGDRPIFMYEV